MLFQVVRELVKYTENFRVLALSATPGSDIKVRNVFTVFSGCQTFYTRCKQNYIFGQLTDKLVNIYPIDR